MLPAVLPLKRWLRMCSKMAAKLINSSDESSIGSAVYFSRRVFTENLKQKHTEKEELQKPNTMQWIKHYFTILHTNVKDLNFLLVVCCTSRWNAAVYCTQADKCTTVFKSCNNSGEAGFFFLFWEPRHLIILRSPQLSCVLHNVPLQCFGSVIMKTIQLTPCLFSLCACCASRSLWVLSLWGTGQHQRMIK